MKKKKNFFQRFWFLFLVIFILIGSLFLIQMTGIDTCERGTFLFKGVTVNYRVCPGIGFLPGIPGSESVYVSSDVDFDEGGFSGDTSIVKGSKRANTKVSGVVEFFFEVSSEEVESISFDGGVSGLTVLNQRHESSGSAFVIGLYDGLVKTPVFSLGSSVCCFDTGSTSYGVSDFSLSRVDGGWSYSDSNGNTNIVLTGVEGVFYVRLEADGSRHSDGTSIGLVVDDLEVSYVSSCVVGEERCEGENYFLCESNPGWVNQGKVVGMCGVMCLSDSDCPSGTVCEGNSCVKRGCPPINIALFCEFGVISHEDSNGCLMIDGCKDPNLWQRIILFFKGLWNKIFLMM